MDEDKVVYLEFFSPRCILRVTDPRDHVIVKIGRTYLAELHGEWYYILSWPGYGIQKSTVSALRELSRDNPRRIKVTKP